jgi:hypothetical protein
MTHWPRTGRRKAIMKSDTLRLMARELAEMVKKMPKLDWTAARVGSGDAAPERAPPACEVRVPAGSVRGRDGSSCSGKQNCQLRPMSNRWLR